MPGHCEQYINYKIRDIILEWVGWTAPILFDEDKESWSTEKWIDEFIKYREEKQNRVTNGGPL